MAATLTGVTYKEGDHKLKGLLEEWKTFWPLNNNGYQSRDPSGQLTPMPEAVEVPLKNLTLCRLETANLMQYFYFFMP